LHSVAFIPKYSSGLIVKIQTSPDVALKLNREPEPDQAYLHIGGVCEVAIHVRDKRKSEQRGEIVPRSRIKTKEPEAGARLHSWR
jgi:hypothetical protein